MYHLSWSFDLSFYVDERLSEGGRLGRAGGREAGKVMQFANCQDASTSVAWEALIQVRQALFLACCKLKKTYSRG